MSSVYSDEIDPFVVAWAEFVGAIADALGISASTSIGVSRGA